MTGIGGKEGAIQAISIHTSAREVTDYDPMKLMSDINFNPHFRKGSDATASKPSAEKMQISIHTSAREVTLPRIPCRSFSDDFNPHFRKGSDEVFAACAEFEMEFQSTLPQGK